jgi:hypothetical protein
MSRNAINSFFDCSYDCILTYFSSVSDWNFHRILTTGNDLYNDKLYFEILPFSFPLTFFFFFFLFYTRSLTLSKTVEWTEEPHIL